MISPGVKLALGAPCFFDSLGEGDSAGDFSALAVGDGVSLGDGDPSGVPVGSGVGEDFFFRRGDSLGDGEGEVFFFFVVGVGDSVSCSGEGDFFFFGEGVADGEGFFFGEGLGVGVGDVFALEVFFFFRGVGVGVGVEKIFLIVWPSDGSAARAGRIDNNNTNATNKRTNMAEALTGDAAFSLNADFGSIANVYGTQLSASRETAGVVNSPV